MKIIDLDPAHAVLVEQVATILREAFEDMTDTWSTLELARDEVEESFGTGHISRVALDDKGNAVGWIGGSRNCGVIATLLPSLCGVTLFPPTNKRLWGQLGM